MRSTAFFSRLLLVCCCFLKASKAGGQLEGLVQSECRDRYLWIQVASAQKPLFEAVDEDGVHSINEQLSARCGYTISTFKMNGFTTFRASYYSCFTHNQNDELFTFRFNVRSEAGGKWSSHVVSTVCSALSWTHRELTCEENYMEVNVNRESSCGGQRAEGTKVWQRALFQAQKTSSLAWQLMFLQNDGQTFSMSVQEAEKWGYSLTATTHRVVFRSSYKQPHAEITMVDGIPVKVLQVSLFFKQKLLMVMVDMSMVCSVNSGLFNGTQLLWNIPQVLPALVGKGARFESQSFRLGLGGALLDEATAFSKGLKVVQQEGMVKIGVPVGTEGGYRKSLVEENVYKEVYTILLMYEHVFSLIYEDGSSIDTKHRILKVLETPLICHPPFSLNQTISGHQEFSVYLGNIPADVILENIWINGKQMLKSDLGISPIVHLNGSQAYNLRLPFDNVAVHWTNVGGGVVQYSINVNFTLTIMPQKESYFHQAFITAQVFNAFPPEMTAQCLEGGISFSVVRQSQSLWEVGIDNEPLTAALVAQRGYHLHNDSHRTILEVPVFSVGYTYEDINLSNFYATFKLLLRNSKTREVQATTSKRCLFRTEDMIVCSADGTMTVVATPGATWPSVQPERTSLLDRTCKPKQTNGARVLFEFQLNSCGTKATVGDWYVVYENEIFHDRVLIADGPNVISREPQFKVTVRCFYPLSAVNRVSMNRIFTSATPGFGSVRVFKDSVNKPCSHQYFENDPKLHPNPAAEGALPYLGLRPRTKPGQSHFITISEQKKELQFTTKQDRSSKHLTSQVPHSYHIPDGGIQWVPRTSQSQQPEEGWKSLGPTLGPFDRIPDSDPLRKQSQKLQSLNSLAEGARGSSLPWGHFSSGQLNIVQQRPYLQKLPTDLSFMTELSKQSLNRHGPSSGKLELVHEVERPVYQHLPQASQVHPFQQPQDHINEVSQTNDQRTLVPADFKPNLSNWSKVLQKSFHNSQSTAASRDPQNLDSLGSFERTAQSKVQNLRVKPPSKFVAYVKHLNQNPVVHQTYSKNSNHSLYTTGLSAGSIYGNQRTPKQTEVRGSNTRVESTKPDVLTWTPKQVAEFQPDSSAMRLTKPFPNQVQRVQKPLSQAEPQPNLVQLLAETENQKPDSVSGVSQTSGASYIRVRPAGLSLRVQTPEQSTVFQSREGGTRTIHQSSVTTAITGEQTPAMGGERLPPFQTYPEGPEDLELMTQSWLGCHGPDGTSVHEGIVRGEWIGWR